MTSSPRVEIAPGIFAESVVRRAGADVSQVYRVTGGVFDHLELDSMSSLAALVGFLSSYESDALRAWGEEPVPLPQQLYRAAGPIAAEPAHRRYERELPAAGTPATAHRRFTCDAGAARRARIWTAETLGDCLPDADWSVTLLEQTVIRAGELVAEAVDAGAHAVLLTLEIDGQRLWMTRFDELPGGREPATGD